MPEVPEEDLRAVGETNDPNFVKPPIPRRESAALFELPRYSCPSAFSPPLARARTAARSSCIVVTVAFSVVSDLQISLSLVSIPSLREDIKLPSSWPRVASAIPLAKSVRRASRRRAHALERERQPSREFIVSEPVLSRASYYLVADILLCLFLFNAEA